MLKLHSFPVEQIIWGKKNSWQAGKLVISPEWIVSLAAEDSRLQRVESYLANPGEKKRIVNILDIVEPREKMEGKGGVFPGILASVKTVGEGITHRLAGIAVMACGRMLPEDTLRDQQEAMIDMYGPGADYTPFSKTFTLVLRCEAVPKLTNRDFEDAIRKLILKVARGLAQLTSDQKGQLSTFDFSEPSKTLPRLVHICELTTFGRNMDTLVYGKSFEESFPTLLTAGEFQDGAVVNADFHYAGQRTPTYIYQNNPVISVMQRLHGQEVNFAGIIITHVHNTNEEKKRAAEFTGKLAQMMGADGALVTTTAGGNAHIDAMFSVKACEERGIKTALVQLETAGEEGADSPFVDYVPEADLIISTGNREEKIDVDPSLELIGLSPEEKEETDSTKFSRIPLRAIYASTNQLGVWNVQGKLF